MTMELRQVRRLAYELMERYGLKGWSFQFDRSKKRFGQCDYNARTISISAYIANLNEETHVRNTVLHEIAHALVGPGYGHGQAWVNVARTIGCTGERCYSGTTVATPKGQWVGHCPNPLCHVKTRPRHRRDKLQCKRCRLSIVWRRNS